MKTYRRFNSYGVLRLYRVEDGASTQIGSFAGEDAPKQADDRQREDEQREPAVSKKKGAKR